MADKNLKYLLPGSYGKNMILVLYFALVNFTPMFL